LLLLKKQKPGTLILGTYLMILSYSLSILLDHISFPGVVHIGPSFISAKTITGKTTRRFRKSSCSPVLLIFSSCTSIADIYAIEEVRTLQFHD
jgi:hypothetical protein